MKNVKQHRYAGKRGAELYDAPGGKVLHTIAPRSWLGVMEEEAGWYKVISARQDGWVKISDTSEAPHASLRAVLSQKMTDLVQNYVLF